MSQHALSTPTPDLDDILPLQTFVTKYPHWTRKRMEWLLYQRHTNGLAASGAVVKICGRWHIVVPAFTEWCIEAGK